jgi:hypothetical protein
LYLGKIKLKENGKLSSLEEKRSRFSTIKDAVATLGYGADRIFETYLPKVLAEGLSLAERREHSVRLWDYLRDREIIMNNDLDKLRIMNLFIADLDKDIIKMERAIDTCTPQMHAQREEWILKIGYAHGYKDSYVIHEYFSEKHIASLKPECEALKQIHKYMEYASADLKCTPQEQRAFDEMCQRHYGKAGEK